MHEPRAAAAHAGASKLGERIDGVAAFINVAKRLLVVGDLPWADAQADLRLLAINSALRRQIESLEASVLLARQGLGHMAVAFVRAAVEDVMYLGFFTSLEQVDSQELFLAFARWDGARSLLAQRKYLGDAVMATLWYPKAFLDAMEAQRDQQQDALTVLRKKYGWQGRLPSAEWIADRAGKRNLYEYLHAATSRAVHFSAGEIIRRSWGNPDGNITTDKPEFREYLAAFALDQLWVLYIDTWQVAMPLLSGAGIGSESALTFDELTAALARLAALGRVPLVHAYEYNLTPRGPVPP
jgi:hypothetical protein